MKRTRGAAGRSMLTGQLLLPLPREYVREISLRNHLALVGCAAKYSIKHSLFEVIRFTYLSYLLWESGWGSIGAADFVEAERTLDTAVNRAEAIGRWHLESQEWDSMKSIIRVHDEQLLSVSGIVFAEAQRKLSVMINSTHADSPIRKRHART